MIHGLKKGFDAALARGVEHPVMDVLVVIENVVARDEVEGKELSDAANMLAIAAWHEAWVFPGSVLEPVIRLEIADGSGSKEYWSRELMRMGLWHDIDADTLSVLASAHTILDLGIHLWPSEEINKAEMIFEEYALVERECSCAR